MSSSGVFFRATTGTSQKKSANFFERAGRDGALEFVGTPPAKESREGAPEGGGGGEATELSSLGCPGGRPKRGVFAAGGGGGGTALPYTGGAGLRLV